LTPRYGGTIAGLFIGTLDASKSSLVTALNPQITTFSYDPLMLVTRQVDFELP